MWALEPVSEITCRRHKPARQLTVECWLFSPQTMVLSDWCQYFLSFLKQWSYLTQIRAGQKRSDHLAFLFCTKLIVYPGSYLSLRAVCTGVMIGFFFVLSVSEFATRGRLLLRQKWYGHVHFSDVRRNG